MNFFHLTTQSGGENKLSYFEMGNVIIIYFKFIICHAKEPHHVFQFVIVYLSIQTVLFFKNQYEVEICIRHKKNNSCSVRNFNLYCPFKPSVFLINKLFATMLVISTQITRFVTINFGC